MPPEQAPESLMEVKGNPWRLTKSEVANATIAVKKDTIPATAKNPAKNKETNAVPPVSSVGKLVISHAIAAAARVIKAKGKVRARREPALEKSKTMNRQTKKATSRRTKPTPRRRILPKGPTERC